MDPHDKDDLTPMLPVVMLADGGVAFANGCRITGRQREIMHCVWLGLENKMIATTLGRAESTIEGHLTRIYASLGLTRARLILLWEHAQNGQPRHAS